MKESLKTALIIAIIFALTAAAIYCGCNAAINKVLGI
jgi:hypothetical protein